jgi:formylglycine-generating enzyme required for sulfatase activity
MQNSIPMNSPLRSTDRVSPLAWLAVLIPVLHAVAQPSAELDIQTYAGLTITGEIGQVYSIEYVEDLAEPTGNDWRCLEFFQLPASPYLWIDRSDSATGNRFYRATAMDAPTNMVFIPPGTFRMGSPTREVDRTANEGPQTAVIISRGAWIGKYEVIQGEYLAVMGSNPSWFNGQRFDGSSNTVDYGTDLSRPVETVSWFDATNYCVVLTQQERASGRIPIGSVYRLPTEAEWEYACRGWTSTRFSYGDDFDYTKLADYAWYSEHSDFRTHPVGQKLPNPWGLYDMHGNVSEWCQDRYEPYFGGIEVDPSGPKIGSAVIRGGSWTNSARSCRSAHRDPMLYMEDGFSNIGFRVLLTPGQP